MIRIAIADDHPLIVEGIGALCRRESDLSVVGTARTAGEAVDVIRTEKPDVAILDLRMPGGDAWRVIEETRPELPDLRVVILTGVMDGQSYLQAIRAGVAGVILKEMALHLLVRCIRKVHAGGRWIETESAFRAMQFVVDAERNALSALLSPREIDVARGAAQGLRNREIADSLGLGEATVKAYLHSVYEKLAVRSRVELAEAIRRNGGI